MSISDELERLQALHECGALSEEEYARAKAQILADTPRAQPDGLSHDSFLRRLSRSRSDRLLGGVCGGFGKHTDVPSWGWRVIFCAISLYFGAGILLYLLLWLFLPLEPSSDQPDT